MPATFDSVGYSRAVAATACPREAPPADQTASAVGATEARLVPGEDGDIETANLMNVTLSLDHRVVDGAMGAQWLQAFKGHLERPAAMLA